MSAPLSLLSNWSADRALAYLLAAGGWVAAHTSDPGPTAQLVTEVAGGGYVRQHITFSIPSGSSILTNTSWSMPGMPACVVTYLGVWDAISDGHLIFRVKLGTPIVVLASAALTGQPEDLGLTL